MLFQKCLLNEQLQKTLILKMESLCYCVAYKAKLRHFVDAIQSEIFKKSVFNLAQF